ALHPLLCKNQMEQLIRLFLTVEIARRPKGSFRYSILANSIEVGEWLIVSIAKHLFKRVLLVVEHQWRDVTRISQVREPELMPRYISTTLNFRCSGGLVPVMPKSDPCDHTGQKTNNPCTER